MGYIFRRGNTDYRFFQPDEGANSVSVYEDGSRIFIGGASRSSDITINNGGGAFYVDTTNTNEQDAFIAEFNSNGLLTWSTYFGDDNSDENILDLEVGKPDLLGNLGSTSGLYCVGTRGNTTPLLPITDAANETDGNGMILRFRVDNNLLWSNAWKCESITSVETDPPNNNFGESIYFTGRTNEDDQTFPVVNPDPNVPQTSNNSGLSDVFVTSLSKTGQINYSFFYGGSCFDFGTAISIDESRNIYVCGFTSSEGSPQCSSNLSEDLPILNGFSLPGSSPYAPTGLILKIAPYFEVSSTPVEILNAGYFGGGFEDKVFSIASRSDGYTFITGVSNSNGVISPPTIQFPVIDPRSTLYVVSGVNNTPQKDAFIAAFDPDFELVWSTYFGGESADQGNCLSVSESDDRLFFAGDALTNNAIIRPNSGARLPVFDFDELNFNDYYQEEPTPTNSFPAWAAFFDISEVNEFLKTEESAEFWDEAIIVYPNPFSHQIQINADEAIENIYIYDLSGKLINQKMTDGKTHAELDLVNIARGTYIINVKTTNGIFSKKLVKL